MGLEIITNSEGETRKLGQMLAKELNVGEVVCLEGDLGGGKTTFVQGLAQGLGIKEWMRSPTFVLIREYNNLYHIDCYRINKKDLIKLNFKEILKSSKIKVIEWADKIKNILPKNCLHIKFEFINANKRKIIIN